MLNANGISTNKKSENSRHKRMTVEVYPKGGFSFENVTRLNRNDMRSNTFSSANHVK